MDFVPPESVFDTFPWPQFEMGSATGPVAVPGGSPDSRSTEIPSPKISDERIFQRAGLRRAGCRRVKRLRFQRKKRSTRSTPVPEPTNLIKPDQTNISNGHPVL